MNDTPIMVGTCRTKCPQSEIKMREYEGLLHIFEMNPQDKHLKRPRCVIEKMVKEYKRPAAGQEVSDPDTLRPVPVLHETIDYLYSIVSLADTEWRLIYDYIFDRLRAVRQDMVIQDIQGVKAIALLEKIVRFYVLAVYRMGVKITPTFDPTINNQHTQECLKRLLSLYAEVSGPHSNQIEFETIYLMFNLGDASALTHYLDLSKSIRNSPILRLAYCASVNYLLRNHVKCLRQIRKIPNILCLCAAQRHFSKIQHTVSSCMGAEVPSLFFNCKDINKITSKLVKKNWNYIVSWKPWQQLENLLNRHNLTDLLLGKQEIPDLAKLNLQDR